MGYFASDAVLLNTSPEMKKEREQRSRPHTAMSKFGTVINTENQEPPINFELVKS